MTPWPALTRFHAAGGARAALRSGAVGVALVVMAFGSQPDPAHTLMRFVTGIVAPAGAPGPTQPRLLLAALLVAFARLGAVRAGAGATGWMASLPVGERTARRGVWMAGALAALPVVLFLGVALVLSPTLYGAPPGPWAVLTLPLLVASAAAAAVRVRRPGAGAIASLATLAATWPSVAGVLLPAVLLWLWDRAAGGVAAPRPRRAARAARPARLASGDARLLALRWAWRATGARPWADGWLLAMVPVGFAALARRNNPDLDPATLDVIGRLGAGLGVVAVVATMAGALLARRSPWGWPRSLPWGARTRVLVDVASTGVPTLPVLVAALVLFGPASLPATLAALLVAAPSAAGALRVGGRRQTGAAGEPAWLGVPVVALVAWYPWLAFLAAPAAWLLVARAARLERESPDAARWSELRHDLAGDAGWISRS